MDLNHLHLHVRDIAASRRFYEKYFGFHRERINEGDFVIVQNDDGFDLALALDGPAPIMPQWFHFGFRLANADAVRELYKQMNSDGIEIFKELGGYDDYVTFRCADPDGYVIEVYWE